MADDEDGEAAMRLSHALIALIRAEPVTSVAMASLTLAVATALVERGVPVAFFAKRVEGLIRKSRAYAKRGKA